MQKIKSTALFVLMLIVLLTSGCTQEVPITTQTPTRTPDGTLRPYPTDTPTSTPLPTDFVSPTPSPTVTPTATQVVYDVQEGDDFYSIGWRFNVSPQAIMTANPTVNPRAMGVGTTLIIPVTPMPELTPTSSAELSPTPEPEIADLQEPNCYPDRFGGLWCFVLIINDKDGALENISGIVDLQEQDSIRTETAIMPLNLLPAGESLPLIAYFQPPVSAEYSVTAKIEFYLPVMPDDERYLNVTIVDLSMTLNEGKDIAEVSGELHLPKDQSGTRYLWLNATALDQAGRVVAVRRWDSPTQLMPGDTIPFNLFLYSMQGEIESVDLLVEARSIQENGEQEE